MRNNKISNEGSKLKKSTQQKNTTQKERRC